VADPVNSHGKAVKPKIFDIVGVGSNTTEYLLGQLSVDYNAAHGKKHNATHPWIYSWDAVPPGNPTNQTSRIIPKSGCPRVARPAGSGAGVTTLFDNTKSSRRYCVNFARSSSYRSSGHRPVLHRQLHCAGQSLRGLQEEAEAGPERVRLQRGRPYPAP